MDRRGEGCSAPKSENMTTLRLKKRKPVDPGQTDCTVYTEHATRGVRRARKTDMPSGGKMPVGHEVGRVGSHAEVI